MTGVGSNRSGTAMPDAEVAMSAVATRPITFLLVFLLLVGKIAMI